MFPQDDPVEVGDRSPGQPRRAHWRAVLFHRTFGSGWKCSLPSLLDRATISCMWPLNTLNVARASEKRDDDPS